MECHLKGTIKKKFKNNTRVHWTVPQGRFLYFNFSLIFFSFVNGHRCNKDGFATRPSDWTSFLMTSLFWLPRSSAIFKRVTSSCGIFYWIFLSTLSCFDFIVVMFDRVSFFYFFTVMCFDYIICTRRKRFTFFVATFFLLFVIGRLP